MISRIVARGLAALVVPLLLAACSNGGAAVPTVAPASAAASSQAATTGTMATTCPTAQPASLSADDVRTVTIDTEKGAIVIEVRGSLSPIATGNFVALASCGYYDGVVFHRVATLQDGTPFVIQGGDGQYGRVPTVDPSRVGSGGPGYAIQDEPVTATYQRGTVAMARSAAPNSVGSQFFIVLDDRARDVLASYNTYQIIGTVTSGMDVADAIYAAADAEIPTNPIPMTKVTVSTP